MVFAFMRGLRRNSISIRSQFMALWYLLHHPDPINDRNPKIIQAAVRKFVAITAKRWKSTNARGVSDFIQSEMLKSFLDKSDQVRYSRIYRALKQNEKEK